MFFDPRAHTPLGTPNVAASAVTHKFVDEVGLAERGNGVLEGAYWYGTSRENEAWVRCWKRFFGAVVDPLVDGRGKGVASVWDAEVHVLALGPDDFLGVALRR